MICLLSEKNRTSFLTVEKEWGYFSDKKDGRIHRMDICVSSRLFYRKKDGRIHRMDICESCYEKMVEKFVIPPEEKQVTEFV